MRPHDERWAGVFEREAAALRAALGVDLVGVHHVGSTAVEGLIAKPIVDLLGEVSRIDAIDGRRGDAEALGWEWLGEYGIPGRRYLRKPLLDPCATRAHVHLFATGDPQVRRHLAFRDALRRDAVLREAYAALKRDLARAHADDRARYTEGKSDFIARALQAVGPAR